MRKIIWTCWFQGRRAAPDLVQRCIASWEHKNPDWEVRCLDAENVACFTSIRDHVDLQRQTITAASLSDLVRLLLLHEYGGVWADATVFCNRPLYEWLSEAMATGFFAFANPGPDRLLASWFLAAAPGNALLSRWAARALRYWRGRSASDDYFWVHHEFGQLCSIDAEARAVWNAVPKISADGPHSVQRVGMGAPSAEALTTIDWSTPVFKLTYRLDDESYRPGALAHDMLQATPLPAPAPAPEQHCRSPAVSCIASLKVGTENLGDHIQIIAAQKLLGRIGYRTSHLIDRDDEIASTPTAADEPVGILLNGWFKTNPAEWPPHPSLLPVYLGFHIRLFQSPTLLSKEALAHYRLYGPVGARDRHTESLLCNHGVEAFLSHCLSLSFARRLPDPERQTEVFIVSRDRTILDYLPAHIRSGRFISHYSGSRNFADNMKQAETLLGLYQNRARLIVTTMLHCALPAIAMGIPVVVFLPTNQGAQRASDLERFSSLSEMIRVFDPSEASTVDWNGYGVDTGRIKLAQIDALIELCGARWGAPERAALGPIAPAAALPVPSPQQIQAFLDDPGRRTALMQAKAPDRVRWRSPASYKPDGTARAERAAALIPDGASVLEVGVGAGHLRQLVERRCRYVGADLEPLDTRTLALDLDRDPLPDINFDHAVLLAVVEYLHHPLEALAKLADRAQTIVVSYCCAKDRSAATGAARGSRGWTNSFTEAELCGMLGELGFACVGRVAVNSAEDFEQFVFAFSRSPQA